MLRVPHRIKAESAVVQSSCLLFCPYRDAVSVAVVFFSSPFSFSLLWSLLPGELHPGRLTPTRPTSLPSYLSSSPMASHRVLGAPSRPYLPVDTRAGRIIRRKQPRLLGSNLGAWPSGRAAPGGCRHQACWRGTESESWPLQHCRSKASRSALAQTC